MLDSIVTTFIRNVQQKVKVAAAVSAWNDQTASGKAARLTPIVAEMNTAVMGNALTYCIDSVPVRPTLIADFNQRRILL